MGVRCDESNEPRPSENVCYSAATLQDKRAPVEESSRKERDLPYVTFLLVLLRVHFTCLGPFTFQQLLLLLAGAHIGKKTPGPL